jgi:SOS response regulatory protein OraA/RecX
MIIAFFNSLINNFKLLKVQIRIAIIILLLFLLYYFIFRTPEIAPENITLTPIVTNVTNVVEVPKTEEFTDELAYAEYYKKRRIAKGYTVKSLADSLGVAPHVIELIEEGQATMIKYKWEKFENLLK